MLMSLSVPRDCGRRRLGGRGGHRVFHLAVRVRRFSCAEAEIPHFAPKQKHQRPAQEKQNLHAQQEPWCAVVMRVGENSILQGFLKV